MRHLHRFGFVLVLTAFSRTLHDNPRRFVGKANRTGCFVDVLAASSAGSVRIDAQVGWVDVNVDDIFQVRVDEAGGESSMSSCCGIKR